MQKQTSIIFSVIKAILCCIVILLVLFSCFHSSDYETFNNTFSDNVTIEKDIENEELYLEAKQLLSAQQYNEALSIFDSLGTYKDSMYHADGIRCMDYANALANELSYSNATFGIVGGMEMYYEYSPEEYTFTSVFEVPKNGLFGVLAGFGVAMGEEANYNQSEMKKMAEELYYEYFAKEGYYYIKCAYEVRDHATENYHLATFIPTEDIPDAISDYYSFAEAVDSYYGIERIEIHTWDYYNPQDIDFLANTSAEYNQALFDTPLTLEECKNLINKLSGYFWSNDSIAESSRIALSISEEYFKDISKDIQYTYAVYGAYIDHDEYVIYFKFDNAPEYLCTLHISTNYKDNWNPELMIGVPQKHGYIKTYKINGIEL